MAHNDRRRAIRPGPARLLSCCLISTSASRNGRIRTRRPREPSRAGKTLKTNHPAIALSASRLLFRITTTPFHSFHPGSKKSLCHVSISLRPPAKFERPLPHRSVWGCFTSKSRESLMEDRRRRLPAQNMRTVRTMTAGLPPASIGADTCRICSGSWSRPLFLSAVALNTRHSGAQAVAGSTHSPVFRTSDNYG